MFYKAIILLYAKYYRERYRRKRYATDFSGYLCDHLRFQIDPRYAVQVSSFVLYIEVIPAHRKISYSLFLLYILT
jgi:hypothetical protein